MVCLVWSVQIGHVRWRHGEEAEGCEGEERPEQGETAEERWCM